MTEPIKFSSKMDEEVLTHLRRYAQDSGRNISSIINEAVAQYLTQVEVRPAFRAVAAEIMETHKDLLERLAR